jgi:hypothetical protein
LSAVFYFQAIQSELLLMARDEVARRRIAKAKRETKMASGC